MALARMRFDPRRMSRNRRARVIGLLLLAVLTGTQARAEDVVQTAGTVPLFQGDIEVVSRTGIDLDPLDVNDADDTAWLSACIWPEHADRQERLRAAVEVASSEPPDLVRGDLVETIDEVLASVPDDVTPVVFHSAVLGYLSRERRAAFAQKMDAHPRAKWFSNELPDVIDGVATTLTAPEHAGTTPFYVVGVSGRDAVAVSDPHGRWLTWAG